MTIYAIVNQKGGSGKTTTTVNLAASLVRLGKRVLIVDLDPQAHATIHLGVAPPKLAHSMYDVLADPSFSPAAAIHKLSEVLHLLPSRIQLSAAELELVARIGREHTLRNKLASLATNYDVVVIDCPPSLGMLSINALCASDQVVIPVQAEYFALEGMTQLLHTIRLVQDQLARPIQIAGVLITHYDGRKTLSQEVRARAADFGPRVFETVIRDTVRLAEAPSRGLDIHEYAAQSHGAEDYLAFAKELTSV